MFILVYAAVLNGAETLERAKNEVREPKPSGGGSSGGASSGGGQSYSSHSDHDNDDLDSFFFSLLFYATAAGIRQAFIWHGEPSGALMGSASFPYQNDWPGWYAPVATDHLGKIPGGQVYAEYGWIEDDLQRYAVGGHVMLSAFTVRSEWHRYIEQVDGGNDTLTLGTITAELGITVQSYARIGIGAGATIYHDDVGSESGPCFVLAVQGFPLKPIVLDGVLTYGQVGDWNTEIMTLRGTIGVVWNRYEVYAGWQLTSIGAVDIDGPTAGLRVWF